jgi:hypothetical protein
MFYIILLLSLFAQTESAQPYFPPQITFVTQFSNTNITYAIDEVNQRAFLSQGTNMPGQLHSYVMEHIPYATPDSPQSKYYVLLENYQKSYCQYSTVWQYGSADAGLFFPDDWYRGTQYEISNYISFRSEMILSNDSAPNEDYWRSVTDCTLDSGDVAPCEEIFFEKNTEIPLRYNAIRHPAMLGYQYSVSFHVISIGKPDDRLFETIPKNWQDNCTDLDLSLEFDNPSVFVHLNQSFTVRIRMTTPPHKENGNDTMILRLQVDETHSICVDCITWEPKEFYFNIENFHEYQNITLTRVKNGFRTVLNPISQGGGFEKVTEEHYLYIL